MTTSTLTATAQRAATTQRAAAAPRSMDALAADGIAAAAGIAAAEAQAAADGIADPIDHFGERASDETIDRFGERASDETIERTAEALRAKGYAVHVVEAGDQARDLIVGLLPEGAEVGQGASTTLEQIGVTHEIEESGRFEAVRKHARAIDRSTSEGLRAMRKLGVGPDWYVNSAHAVTADGTIVIASNTGSQLAPLAFGAGEVIFAIGSQKLVPDLETAMRRLETHTLPLENVRMQGLYGTDSEIKKLLIIHKEFRPSRFTVVLIKEPVGF